jgi:hypothetical protein
MVGLYGFGVGLFLSALVTLQSDVYLRTKFCHRVLDMSQVRASDAIPAHARPSRLSRSFPLPDKFRGRRKTKNTKYDVNTGSVAAPFPGLRQSMTTKVYVNKLRSRSVPLRREFHPHEGSLRFVSTVEDNAKPRIPLPPFVLIPRPILSKQSFLKRSRTDVAFRSARLSGTVGYADGAILPCIAPDPRHQRHFGPQ